MPLSNVHGLPALEIEEVEEGDNAEEVYGGVENHGVQQEEDFVSLVFLFEDQALEEVVLNQVAKGMRHNQGGQKGDPPDHEAVEECQVGAMGGQVGYLALVELAEELQKCHQHVVIEENLENPEYVVG